MFLINFYLKTISIRLVAIMSRKTFVAYRRAITYIIRRRDEHVKIYNIIN